MELRLLMTIKSAILQTKRIPKKENKSMKAGPVFPRKVISVMTVPNLLGETLRRVVVV